MRATWYEVNVGRFGFTALPIEIERETDHAVYINGTKVMKAGRSRKFFKTERIAKEYMVDLLNSRRKELEESIETIDEELNRLEGGSNG